MNARTNLLVKEKEEVHYEQTVRQRALGGEDTGGEEEEVKQEQEHAED
jgi:hypothetical protein